jgi:hypothetical protein
MIKLALGLTRNLVRSAALRLEASNPVSVEIKGCEPMCWLSSILRDVLQTKLLNNYKNIA